jgi:tRNA(adenine34) deaminase
MPASIHEDKVWMQEALVLARKAEEEGEVPVGAVLVQDNKILGQGWNRPVASHDPSAHAEIQAIRHAGSLVGNYRLPGSTLYVTLEPCTMCAGAIIHARIKRLVFGAYDPRTGAIESVAQILDQSHHNHKTEYQGGVMESECSQLLKAFFAAKRLT